MLERDFMNQVTGLALLTRWQIYHTHDSRRSQPGFPDMVLVRPPRVVMAELKSETGRVRPEQQEWLDLLDKCPGVESYLWRPADWEEIMGVLK